MASAGAAAAALALALALALAVVCACAFSALAPVSSFASDLRLADFFLGAISRSA